MVAREFNIGRDRAKAGEAVPERTKRQRDVILAGEYVGTRKADLNALKRMVPVLPD